MKALTPLVLARYEAHLNQMVSYKGKEMKRFEALMLNLCDGWKVEEEEVVTGRNVFDRKQFSSQWIEKKEMVWKICSPCGEFSRSLTKIEKWWIDTGISECLPILK